MKFPTQLTVLRILLAPVFFTFFVLDPPQYLLSGVVFVFASLTDWYDGYYARKMKLASRFGAFLDPLADKILTSIAFIAFATIGLIPAWAAAIIIARDVIMTLLRMVADAHDMPVRTSSAAKAKTFVQMFYIIFVLLLLATMDGIFGEDLREFGRTALDSQWLSWGILIVVALTVLTFVQYLYANAGVARLSIAKYIFRRGAQNS